jgi:hypothetical protein
MSTSPLPVSLVPSLSTTLLHSLVSELANPRQFTELESFCASSPPSPPSREYIFRFLLSLRPGWSSSLLLLADLPSPGVSLGEVVASNPKLVRSVDLPRLLGMAQYLGLIRRVRKYPILQRDDNGSSAQLKIAQHFGLPDPHSLKPASGGYQSGRKRHPHHYPSVSADPSPPSIALSSCGPSTDEICCVMDLSRGDIEEASPSWVWK